MRRRIISELHFADKKFKLMKIIVKSAVSTNFRLSAIPTLTLVASSIEALIQEFVARVKMHSFIICV